VTAAPLLNTPILIRRRSEVNNFRDKGGTYPPDPLPLVREGGIIVSEGADAPSGFPFTIRYQRKGEEGLVSCGDRSAPLKHPDIIKAKGGEVNKHF